MTQRDMAGYLGVAPETIRNWRKNRPQLYKIVMLGFRFEQLMAKMKKDYDEMEELINTMNIKEELRGYKRKD